MKESIATIRPARPAYEEGMAFAKHINIASEGGFSKILGKRFVDIVATAFTEPDHDLSFDYVFFAERGGEIVGMASGNTGVQHGRSSSGPLKRAPGNRLRRIIGLWLLGIVSRVIGNISEHTYYVQFLSVDERFRGRGIGTELLMLMESQARRCECTRLAIGVSAKNIGAKRLYSRFGFELISEWPRVPLLPRAMYRMEKSL